VWRLPVVRGMSDPRAFGARAWLVLGVGLSVLAFARPVAAQILPALPAGHWQFFNTCWADFDVGGGTMCGVRHKTCNPDLRTLVVSCQSGDVDPSSGAASYITYNNLPNDAKAIAVDDDGRAWVVTVDNRIYHTWGRSWQYWHAVYGVVANGCADQIAVIGGISNPTVMLRGCDHGAYKFIPSQNTWKYMLGSVRDLSTGANPVSQDGSTAFFAVQESVMNSPVYAFVTDRWNDFAPLNTSSHMAIANVPGDCYATPGGPWPETCKQSNAAISVHSGGGELTFHGQYPAGATICDANGCHVNPEPDCVTYTPDGHEWYPTPWFASLTANPGTFLSYDIVGHQQVDQFNMADSSRLWLAPSQYRHQVDTVPAVCRQMIPPTNPNIVADPDPIKKIREGAKYGRLGGLHTAGSLDVRWILTDSAQVHSFEVP
jgi:hypothetical protein